MNEDIIDLQTKLAFQDSLLEELNQVITDQQKQIDRLQHSIEVLKSQLLSVQAHPLLQETNEPPPPHY